MQLAKCDIMVGFSIIRYMVTYINMYYSFMFICMVSYTYIATQIHMYVCN